MRPFGICLVVVGAVWILYALNMDVSVSVPTTYVPYIGSVGGGEVANLDMMARRQNHLIIGSLLTLIGALMAIFGKPMEEPSKEPTAVESIPLQSKFTGERDLSNDAYRLWLAKRYAVQRNEVFNSFVVGEDKTFGTLDDALGFAHEHELEAELANLRATEERRARREAEDERLRLIREEADAQWEQSKPKVFVAVALAVVVIVITIWLSLETPEEKAARLAEEAAAQRALVAEITEKLGVDLPTGAKNVRVDKVSGSVWCDNSTPDTIAVEFEPVDDAKSTKDHFSKELGEGSRKYEYLENDFDWNWKKSKNSYQLVFHGEETMTAILCKT